MNDGATTFLSNFRTIDLLVYALLGSLGLLALAIDGFVNGVFLKRFRRAVVRPNPPRHWGWLLALFVLVCIFAELFVAPAFAQNGHWQWGYHVFAYVFPVNLKEAWFLNVFEELFRFGTFFLLIRFMRLTIAACVTTLIFVLAHAYYYAPLDEALANYLLAFVLGGLLLFIGLRFGILTAYVFHVAINTFQLGGHVDAPLGWLWVNWLLALFVGVALVYAFGRAGLWELDGVTVESGDGMPKKIGAAPT